MPAFPSFARRLAEINNPMNRAAADTPMRVGGFPVGAATGGNPMRRRRPMGIDGQIPLVQDQTDEAPPTSGTGAEPRGEGNPVMSKVKQQVAQDVRYEDIAPKMEEIPGDPQFQPHSKHGFKDRLKAALYGSQAAAAQQPSNQFAGIGGMIGGLINPGGAEQMAHQYVTLPRARQEQMAVMQRNKARQEQAAGEINNRYKFAQMNEMNAPQWGSVAGGETPTLFEKKSGETRPVLGPDGKPMRNASVVNAETRADSSEEIARQKRMADAERDIEKKKSDFEKAKMKYDHDRELADLKAKHQKEIEQMREAGRNRRAGQSEAGKNSRSAASLAERKRATNLRYGDEGDAPKTELDQQINKISEMNAAKKAKRKQAAPPAQ